MTQHDRRSRETTNGRMAARHGRTTRAMRNLTATFAALALIGSAAQAAQAECDSTGRCENVTVERLLPYASGTTLIQTSGTESWLSSQCQAISGYLKLNRSDPGAENVLSVILAAQLTGKPLSLRVKSTPGSFCEISSVWLDR